MFTQWEKDIIMRILKRKGGDKLAQITKDMTFGELLSKYYDTCPKIVDVLIEAGMGCIGCPHSQMESIEEGAMGHGIDPDLLIAKLNATLQARQE